MTPRETDLVAYLKGGVYSAAQLAHLLGGDAREIRRTIRHLRIDEGLPICGVPETGFFMPTCRQDAEHTRASLKAQIRALASVLFALEKGLDREFGTGQLTLLKEAV